MGGGERGIVYVWHVEPGAVRYWVGEFREVGYQFVAEFAVHRGRTVGVLVRIETGVHFGAKSSS